MTSGIQPSLADFQSVEQLTAWLVSETDAMCPLPERLQSFAANRTADEFSDLRFHVEEAGCPFCQQQLQWLGTPIDPEEPVSTAFREFWGRSARPDSNSDAAMSRPEHPNASALTAESARHFRDKPADFPAFAESRALKEEFAAHFEPQRSALCGWIRKHFPRLAWQAEDIVQDMAVETLRKIHEGFRPKQSWNAWLWWLLPKRMTDRTREHELVMLEALAAPGSGRTPDVGQLPLRKPAATPSDVAVEGERRGRQLRLLSDVFREFCREHETTTAGRKRKDIFERGLRGQKRTEIVSRMDVPRGTVDRYMGEAYAWILDRALQADVNRSVFLTLQRRR